MSVILRLLAIGVVLSTINAHIVTPAVQYVFGENLLTEHLPFIVLIFGLFWFFCDWVVERLLGGLSLSHFDFADETTRKSVGFSVAQLAARANMPVPKVFVMEGESANAFASGLSPGNAILGITRGAINQLTGDELEALLAHELTHIKRWHPLKTLLAFFVLSETFIYVPYLPMLVTLGLFAMLFFYIRRCFERQADAAAVELVGKKQVLSMLFFISRDRRPSLQCIQDLLQAKRPRNGLFASHPKIINRIQDVYHQSL